MTDIFPPELGTPFSNIEIGQGYILNGATYRKVGNNEYVNLKDVGTILDTGIVVGMIKA